MEEKEKQNTGGNQASTGSVFTQPQITVLLCQIYAFKLLSANSVIPPRLRQIILDAAYAGTPSATDDQPQATILPKVVKNVFTTYQKQQQIDPGTGASSSPVIQSVEDQMKKKGSTQQQGKKSGDQKHNRTQNGSVLLHTKAADTQLAQARLIPLCATPVGIDPKLLLHERERQLNSRIEYRIKELEMLPTNLSVDSSAKVKSMIELKALKLVKKQRMLRSKILTYMKKNTTLATAIDRNLYRRAKRRDLREAMQIEKLECTRRMESEKEDIQKYNCFLDEVVNHSRDVFSVRKRSNIKTARILQAISRYHANAQREDRRIRQRNSQERLTALRANDEAAYLKLVDKEKDNRIIHLLNKTESYLGSLTKAVKDQKMEITDKHDESAPKTPPLYQDEDVSDYYSTAHKITETVTQQPSLLVGGKLKDYQIKGLQWMLSLYNNKLNGILADEMGLGKTIQTISFITYLIEKKRQIGPYLVIVPLSTITNWDIEFERWAPSISRIVFKGIAQERQKLKSIIKSGNFNVLITTYEFIIKEKSLLGKFRWVYMIIDEGHRMKNAQSKLSTTLMHHYSSRYRLILTGTPLQNSLPELWAILNFILPKIFNSVETFDEWFNHPFSKDSGKDSDVRLNEEESLLIIRGLHKVLRPFLLRRLKKDVESELPDKIEIVIKCPMSALQHLIYEQIKNNKSVFGLDSASRRKALNNLVMQFRKVCNHPYVFEEVEQFVNPSKITDDNLWRVSGKFEFLDRVLPKFRAMNHRVLIFFQMTHVMDIMEDYLIYRGYTYLRLDGHTKTEDRTEMLRSFNSDGNPPFIFLLSTRAGGLGLNLQTADTVIIFDSDWNPHQDLQAQDRAHRIGQTNEVRILRLITSRSIEENILARAQYKLDMDGKVIQAGKFDNKTTDSERDELLRSLFGTADAAGDKEASEEILDDAELNEIIARSEEELEAYNQMDVERIREMQVTGKKTAYDNRLFTEKEIPEALLRTWRDEEATQESEVVMFGRGARARKAIKYDDGMNEEQFLEAIEDGTYNSNYTKRKRITHVEYYSCESSSSCNDDGGSSNNTTYPRRKCSSFPSAESDVSQDEYPVVPTPTPRGPRKKIRPADDPLSPASRTRLNERCLAAYEVVLNCEAPPYDNSGDNDDDGDCVPVAPRKCSDLFLKVPSRTLYPDYWQTIKHPMSLDIIRKKIVNNCYRSLAHFASDMNLMFSNARRYNVEGSEICNDAIEMSKAFDGKIKEYDE